MLVFAAITPHTPLLIADIGKEHAQKLTASISSLKILEEHFYAAQADTLIIISPHTDIESSAFVINFAPIFHGSFAEFGYLSENPAYYGDNSLSYRLKKDLQNSFPITLTTVEELHYSIIVPLHYLLAHKKPTPIVPLYCPARSLHEHIALGQRIAETIAQTSRRIAVIASAETSHKLNKLSPAGFEAGAKRFDQKILHLIAEKKVEELAALRPNDLEKYGLDDLRAISLLLGILAEQRCTTNLLSYESPFGIGHLSLEFAL